MSYRPSFRPLLNLLAPLLVATLSAADSLPLPSDPVFTATLTDATSVTGRLQHLDGEKLTLAAPEGGTAQSIPIRRLVKLSREGLAPAAQPGGSFALVLFPEGDRLHGVVLGAATETAL